MNKLLKGIPLLILYALFWPFLSYAQTYTISGYIRDHHTKECLIGATVYEPGLRQGSVTNSYGFYSLTLPAGEVQVAFSYVGYQTTVMQFSLRSDTTLQIMLTPATAELGEVVVMGGNPALRAARPGTMDVPIEQINSMPALLGETDLMKSLQLLPGVQTTSEGKSDISVRGGGPDQNLILLDGIPIYNPNHIFGFLSIFNTDAIKNVTLYKSGFPARFGGRLSSVVDIQTKEGNKQEFKGSATIGILAAKANIEGPLIKDKTSFTLSVRRTYIDLFMDQITKWINQADESISNENKYNLFFYDINAKLHHQLSNKTSMYVMFYNGQDKLKTQYGNREGYSGEYEVLTNQDWKWGSTIAAVRLNRVLAGNAFLNTTVSFNNYHYKTFLQKQYEDYWGYSNETRMDRIFYDSGIRDYSFVSDLDYIPAPGHYIRSGLAYTYHNFKPEVLNAEVQDRTTDLFKSSSGERIHTHEVALYAEDDWDVTERLRANIGFRYSLFQVKNKTWHSFDPRLSFRYLLTDAISLKAGYSQMKQFIHLLSSNTLFLQTDLWVPVTDKVSPMSSHQISAGAFFQLPHQLEFTVEGYYKGMKNVVEYKDGASFVGGSGNWENKVEAGDGRAYGIEFSVQKKLGNTTGWISYTLAKTERKFKEINYNEWFPAKYDRRHNLNVTLTHQLSEKFDLSANWVCSSGNVITLPLERIVSGDIPDDSFFWREVFQQFDHRNNYRLSTYHRLDVGVSYFTKRNARRYGVLNLSIYNLYNRQNPLLLYADVIDEEDESGAWKSKQVLKQVTIFPIMPSLSFTYYF
ncbi:MAG: TonB-dependent receptor [Tannerellaceae bacterium]|nr:TonB-dependent receptor [Tannerellaceae bacterium]